MNNIRIRYILLAMLFFASGIVIYILFRNENIIFFEYFGILAVAKALFVHINMPNNTLQSIIAYNIPDGLWTLSGIMVIRAIWYKYAKICKLYVFIFSWIAIIFELLQLFDRIPGTFDILDLIVIVLVIAVENIIYAKALQKK